MLIKELLAITEAKEMKAAGPLRRGYTVALNDTEYKTLRRAKMRGDFSHPYKTVEVSPGHNNVTFKTSDPKKLARDLEKIIDAGETSWAEILNINESTEKDDIGFKD